MSVPDPAVPVGPARGGKRWAVRLACLLGSLVGVLGLVELSVRTFAPVKYLEPVKTDAFEGFHRAGTIPWIEYEPRPSQNPGRFAGVPVRTNAFGLRGPDVTREKPPGVFRIAAVGDSFTFGQGVGDSQTFVHVLQSLLDEALGGAGKVEALNFGVTGYSTRDEAAVVHYRALEFSPDLIVLSYYLNDPEDHPDHPLHRAFHRRAWWEHSHVLRWLHGWRHRRGLATHRPYARYLHEVERHWKNTVQGFAEIAEDAARRGVPVLLAVIPQLDQPSWRKYGLWDVHEQVLAEARKNGFETLDLGREMEALRIPPDAILLEDGIHATARGNRLFGWLLFRRVAEGWLGLEAPPVDREALMAGD